MLANPQISSAGQLARDLVRSSTLFPAYRRVAVSYDLVLGGRPDPTVQSFDAVHERYVKQLLRAAHDKAFRIVKERQPAIRSPPPLTHTQTLACILIRLLIAALTSAFLSGISI